MIRSAKNWIIAPPPTQITAMAMCEEQQELVPAQQTLLGATSGSKLEDQKSFCNFIAAPMSPLILSLPVM